MELNIKKIKYESVKKRKFSVNVTGNENIENSAKILSVTARSCCGRSEILNDEVIVEGIVKFTAIIKVDDKIKKVEKSERFTVNESVSGVKPDSYIVTSSSVNKVRGYTEAGKIMFACSVDIHSIIILKDEIEYVDELNEDFRKKDKTISFFETSFFKTLRFNINEETELSPRVPEINEILSTDAFVTVKEAHVSAGQLIIGGEIATQTIYNSVDEYEPVIQVSDKFEFSHLIDIDAMQAQNPVVVLDIEDIDTKIKVNEQGEMRIIEYNVCLCGYGFSGEYNKCEIVTDAYSIKNKVECENTKAQFSVLGEEISESLNKNISVKIPDGINPISRVNSVTFVPEVIDTEVKDSKIIIKCSAETGLVYTASNTGDTEGYNSTVNFEIIFENSKLENINNAVVYLGVCDMQAVLVKGNEVEIRAGINVKIIPEININETVLSNITVSEENDFPEFGIIIYNVQYGDTLWEICKKYGVDEEEVIQLNGDLTQGLESGKKLYLFRKLAV